MQQTLCFDNCFWIFFIFAMESCLALLLISSKKQPSLEKPHPSTVPETVGMLPGSVVCGLWNVWVFLWVFPLTIEGCTQRSCSWRPRSCPGLVLARAGWGCVQCPCACGLFGLLWHSPGGGGGVWAPAWLCLASSGKEAGCDKKMSENLHWLRLSRRRCSPLVPP